MLKIQIYVDMYIYIYIYIINLERSHETFQEYFTVSFSQQLTYILKVTMNTEEAASLATKEANPVIDGRKANVNLAYLGAKPRVIPSPAGKFRFKYDYFSLLCTLSLLFFNIDL